MRVNEMKCHATTSLGLVGGMHPLHPPLCPRLTASFLIHQICCTGLVRPGLNSLR